MLSELHASVLPCSSHSSVHAPQSCFVCCVFCVLSFRVVCTYTQEAASSKYTAGHYYCALYVKAAIKGFLARRMISPLWEALDAREELDRKSRNGLVKIASKPLGFNSIAKLSPEQRRAILDGMTDAVDVGDSFGRAKSSTAAALSMLPLTRRTSQTTPPTEWPTLAASQAHIQTSQDGRPREDSAESALSHT